jgi:hypothetical protein
LDIEGLEGADGYGASANGPNVPQVHQNCVRADLIAKIWPESDSVYDLTAIDNSQETHSKFEAALKKESKRRPDTGALH